MRPQRTRALEPDPVAFLKSLATTAERRRALAQLGEEEREALDRAWPKWAHAGQLAPEGDWSTWVIKAGRGFGKTLAGAQWLTG